MNIQKLARRILTSCVAVVILAVTGAAAFVVDILPHFSAKEKSQSRSDYSDLGPDKWPAWSSGGGSTPEQMGLAVALKLDSGLVPPKPPYTDQFVAVGPIGPLCLIGFNDRLEPSSTTVSVRIVSRYDNSLDVSEQHLTIPEASSFINDNKPYCVPKSI